MSQTVKQHGDDLICYHMVTLKYYLNQVSHDQSLSPDHTISLNTTTKVTVKHMKYIPYLFSRISSRESRTLLLICPVDGFFKLGREILAFFTSCFTVDPEKTKAVEELNEPQMIIHACFSSYVREIRIIPLFSAESTDDRLSPESWFKVTKETHCCLSCRVNTRNHPLK